MSAPRAIAFDLFGTLVDFRSLQTRFVTLTADAAGFVEAWRAKQLQYAFLSTMMERYENFDTVTERALDYVCDARGITLAAGQRREALEAWHGLPAYDDVAPALRALRAQGVRTAVLSNGTPQAIAQTLEGAGIDGLLDGALSVDAVRQYKPRPAVYQLAVDFFGVAKDALGFVSSNGWDAAGAAAFGLQVVWCNRSLAPQERVGGAPSRTVSGLHELAG